MTLEQLIEVEELEPVGVERYLRECEFAMEIGRRVDPMAIDQVRRASPSRFRLDGAHLREKNRVRGLLARYVEVA